MITFDNKENVLGRANRDDMLSKTLNEIVCLLRSGSLSTKRLEKLLRTNSKRLEDSSRRISKKELLSFYLAQKSSNSANWQSLNVDEKIDDALIRLLRAKPRRTASGVATVTVLTKPWPCGGDCLCCPSDIRMPKSYLSDEPACQRAERCWFDPYLQMSSRLSVLEDMGHNIDKIEVIVLGGTFSDYPKPYRIWFIEQLFEALNDFGSDAVTEKCNERRRLYAEMGLSNDAESLAKCATEAQSRVNRGELSYNEAITAHNESAEMREIASMQMCAIETLHQEQRRNTNAHHRDVGLCIETRPELITPEHLTHLRDLGCTKIQIGVQSLSNERLEAMGRTARVSDIDRAFELLRLFGFKSHIHIMANLPKATAASDAADFEKLISDPKYMPDEIKLYPCTLVESAHLTSEYQKGDWTPYNEKELVELLAKNVRATPCHTRISRMIRDISSTDIIAGNKKTNLRQMVEEHVMKQTSAGASKPNEMRLREIATLDDHREFHIEEYEYATSNTCEVFLQYVDKDGNLAAFCRLSMPNADAIDELSHKWDMQKTHDMPRKLRPLEIRKNEAMIREVHVYGRVSKLHEVKEGSQHQGFGRSLIERACNIAKNNGYHTIAVISAIGTREYYSKLNFELDGLYQRRQLL